MLPSGFSPMRLSTYLKIWPDGPHHVLLYATRRCSVVRVTREILRDIETGMLSAADSATLARLGVLTPDPMAEREELCNRFAEANRLNAKFHAIVILNLDCNLACSYCFEAGVRDGSSMSPETADCLVGMIERDHFANGRQVSLDFYGGEPLLSFNLIRSIAGRLKQSSAEQGLTFSFSLVTNGTLITRTVTEELNALGLRDIKVTLDGPREFHDRSRPFASGKGSSFDLIVRNLCAVADLVGLQLGGNFTRENYRAFPLLLDHLLAVGLTPDKVRTIQFNPVIATLGARALPDFRTGCDCSSEDWLAEAALLLREEALKRGFIVPKPGPAGCMAELDNDLVVNHDGSFYRCPAFIGRDGFAVGDLRRGVVDYTGAYNRDVWKKSECLECAYLPHCFGGCRYMKFVRDGHIADVDCWRSFLDATLEESVRQDLAYQTRKR
jgi:uncharacterized protein